MTWCRYHCRGCSSHFTSLEAFDAHHGSEPCTFPGGIDFVEAAGTCRIGDPARAVAGTVYSTKRAFRAADYFRPINGRQTARARRKHPRISEAVVIG